VVKPIAAAARSINEYLRMVVTPTVDKAPNVSPIAIARAMIAHYSSFNAQDYYADRWKKPICEGRGISATVLSVIHYRKTAS
jgi:hypothetical protein